jgi:hypothetical protein
MPLLKVDVVDYDSVNQICIGSSSKTQCKENVLFSRNSLSVQMKKVCLHNALFWLNTIFIDICLVATRFYMKNCFKNTM